MAEKFAHDDYERQYVDREFEMAMLQIEYMMAGYDGRHAGLFYFIPFCHDTPEQP